MKSINKKLYIVIAVCLLTMIFSVVALAENGATSTPTSPSSNTATSQVGGNESDTNSGSSTDNESDNESDNGSDEENGSEDGDSSDSSELTDSDSSLTSDEENGSDTESTMSNGSSSNSGYHGNIGGTVSDGIDTSGWGTTTESSAPVSVGTTEKTGNKKITDFNTVFWVMLIVGIVLMIGAIVALICVNRKSFLKIAPVSGGKDDTTKSQRQKRKNNHKNRTNVYRPRD